MSVLPRGWRSAKFCGRPWQDLVFSAGEVVFLIALAPSLFARGTHIPVYTGLSTSLMLYAFGAVQASYRNWLTLGLGLTTATIWLLLGLGVHL